MEKIKVIHDRVGETLTIWLTDPHSEYICEENSEEILVMKNQKGEIIGVEILHFHSNEKVDGQVIIETILQTSA